VGSFTTQGLVEGFAEVWNSDGADMTNESKSSSWPGHRSCLLPAAMLGFRGYRSVASSTARRAVECELLYRRRAGTVCAGFDRPLGLVQIVRNPARSLENMAPCFQKCCSSRCELVYPHLHETVLRSNPSTAN